MQKYNKPQQPTDGASSCYATMQQPPATMHHAAATGNSTIEHSIPAHGVPNSVARKHARAPARSPTTTRTPRGIWGGVARGIQHERACARAVGVECCAKRMGAESRLGLAATKARSHLRPLPLTPAPAYARSHAAAPTLFTRDMSAKTAASLISVTAATRAAVHSHSNGLPRGRAGLSNRLSAASPTSADSHVGRFPRWPIPTYGLFPLTAYSHLGPFPHRPIPT